MANYYKILLQQVRFYGVFSNKEQAELSFANYVAIDIKNGGDYVLDSNSFDRNKYARLFYKELKNYGCYYELQLDECNVEG